MDRDVFGASQARDVMSTDDLMTHRGVVLLGEPGAGKTTAVAHLAAATRDLRPEEATEGSVVCVDLAADADESRLFSEVFRSPAIEAWMAADGELHVFLESLDEYPLEVRKLATISAQELARWPSERLWLRIACRTADWPGTLGAAIAREMGDPLVVEVLPLCRREIVAIAESDDVSGTAFA